ncbi:MAG: hypothetical protein QXS02_01345 [Candidatus Thermoplasmatota archaeon]
MDMFQTFVGGVISTGDCMVYDKYHPFLNDLKGLSEILGTLLMIAIAVSAFTVISLIIINPWVNLQGPEQSFVNIVGYIYDDSIILEHQGGGFLPGDTLIKYTVGTFEDKKTYKELNNDDSWGIGESVRIDLLQFGGWEALRVTSMVVDNRYNSVIFDKTLHNGLLGDKPYVIVYQPLEESISETGVTLRMRYNFVNNGFYSAGDKSLKFVVIPDIDGGEPVVYPVIPQGVEAAISLPITGLASNMKYVCNAKLEINSIGYSYTSNTVYFYTYGELRGYYPINSDGNEYIYDNALPKVHGSIKGNPKYVKGYDGSENGALSFPTVDDYVVVPNHNKYNLTSSLRISTWMKLDSFGIGNFPGKINKVSVFSMGDAFCYHDIDMIHVSGDIYAIAGHDYSALHLVTVEINESGYLQRIINDQSFSAQQVPYIAEPDIIKLEGSNDVYAISLGAQVLNEYSKNMLVTIRISNDGNNINLVDSYIFPTYYGRHSVVKHVTGDIYLISFGGASNPSYTTGYLFTVSINSQGVINDGYVGYFKLQGGSYCTETDIAYVDERYDLFIFAVFYGGSSDGINYNRWINTISVSPQGLITNGLLFDAGYSHYCHSPCVTMIRYVGSSVTFAVGYGGGTDPIEKKGCILTVSILSDGSAILPGDIFILPRVKNCSLVDMIHVNDTIYLCAYSDRVTSVCYLITVGILTSGEIVDVHFDEHRIVGDGGVNPVIIRLSNQNRRYGVMYSRSVNFCSFFISVDVEIKKEVYKIIMKQGSYSLELNSNLLIGKIWNKNGEVNITGRLNEIGTWYMIDLTYDGSKLTLKIISSDIMTYTRTTTGEIPKSSSDLVIGSFPGAIDEIQIYSRGGS